MNDLHFQTHSVYREKATGRRFLFIHHDPMNLRSLVLNAEKDGAAYDMEHPIPVSVDSVIEIRRSGYCEELAPLSSGEFTALTEKLIASGILPENDTVCLKRLLADNSPA